MAAFAILFLLVPVLLIAVVLGGAWFEGRRSPYAFGIGRVISNAFGAVGGAPLALFAASALLNAPIQLLLPTLVHSVNDVGRIETAGAAMAPFGILWLLAYSFIALFMTRIALDALAERSVDLGAALRMALRRTLPALGMVILLWIGVTLGFLFLIVPGIVLLLTWFIVLPVMAGEGRGVFDCFGRSSQLLRGMRWRLLLLLLIAGVLWLLASTLVQGVAFAVFGSSGSMWGTAAVQALFSTLAGVLPATGAAAVYREAIVAKEGSGSHDLSDVFA